MEEIHINNYNNNLNINLIIGIELDDNILIDISQNNENFNYCKDNNINEIFDYKEYYENQQKEIKKMSKFLNYYEKYIDKNIILKNFFIITDFDFDLRNLKCNNYEISKIENIVSNNNFRKIYIKNIKDIDFFLNLINFYETFKNYIYKLQSVKNDKPGILNFSNINKTFETKRIFTLSDFSDLNQLNNKRGLHYNTNFDEILIINSGEINIEIINPINIKIFINLKKNNIIYFPRNFWFNFEILDESTNITVLSNKLYEESISCYDFNKFTNLI